MQSPLPAAAAPLVILGVLIFLVFLLICVGASMPAFRELARRRRSERRLEAMDRRLMEGDDPMDMHRRHQSPPRGRSNVA